MLLRIWKTKSCFFIENDKDAENCCLENFLVSKSGSLRVPDGILKVTIYNFFGECSPAAKYFQQHRRVEYEVTSYQLPNFATRKWNLHLPHSRSMFPFYTPWQRLKWIKSFSDTEVLFEFIPHWNLYAFIK